jgi:hypothetical protein
MPQDISLESYMVGNVSHRPEILHVWDGLRVTLFYIGDEVKKSE